jgi:hypothetical protein
MRGVRIREERARLIEGNITGNLNATSNRITTTISIMLRVNHGRHTIPNVSIALSSHEAGEEQRQHNRRNKSGYTTTADHLDAQVEG